MANDKPISESLADSLRSPNATLPKRFLVDGASYQTITTTLAEKDKVGNPETFDHLAAALSSRGTVVKLESGLMLSRANKRGGGSLSARWKDAANSIPGNVVDRIGVEAALTMLLTNLDAQVAAFAAA